MSDPSPLPPPPPRRDLGADTVVPDAADTVVPTDRDTLVPPPRPKLRPAPPMTRLITQAPDESIARTTGDARQVPVPPPEAPADAAAQPASAMNIPPTLAEFDGTVPCKSSPGASDPFAHASIVSAQRIGRTEPSLQSSPSAARQSARTAEHVFVPDQRRLEAIAATYPGWPNHSGARLIGGSPLMNVLFEKAQAVADRLYANPDDAGAMSSEALLLEPGPPVVLIDGAYGTGRRQVARALLALGPNRDGPIVHVDCAADAASRDPGLLRAPTRSDRRRHRPPDRDYVALFGASPNVRDRAHGAALTAMPTHGPNGGLSALMANAAGGMIVFANTDHLSRDAQRELVAFLEPAAYPRRAGAPDAALARRSILRQPDGTPIRIWPHPNHILVVLTACGTFQEHVAAGRIEPTLWQLATAYQRHLTLPRLWERKTDIGPLIDCFTRQAAVRFGLPHRQPADGTAKALSRFDWPENVTQLRRACELAVLQSLTDTLQPEDFLDL